MSAIVTRDKVIINLNNIAIIDGSRAMKGGKWWIAFKDSNDKIVQKWAYDTEQDRNTILLFMQDKLNAVTI